MRDLAAEAEAVPEERTRRAEIVRARLRAAGLHLYPAAVAEAVTQLIEDECVVVRKRIAALIDNTREHRDGEGLSDEDLERFAFVVLAHQVHGDEMTLPLDGAASDE